jgi:hypothetical protein
LFPITIPHGDSDNGAEPFEDAWGETKGRDENLRGAQKLFLINQVKIGSVEFLFH